MSSKKSQDKTLYQFGLFNNDWFLIEFGKHLISIADEDLISFLCLNKEINKRAQPIFRKYFLNFELQKEFVKLAKSHKWQEVEIFWNLHPFALNPNFSIPSTNDTDFLTPFFNDKQLNLHISDIGRDSQYFDSFDCPSISFAVALSRQDASKFSQFTKQIIENKRFDYTKLAEHSDQFAHIELVNWIVYHGHLPILNSIIMELKLLCTHSYKIADKSFEMLIFPILISIVYDRLDILKAILSIVTNENDWYDFDPSDFTDENFGISIHLTQTCIDLNATHHFEEILKSTLCKRFLNRSCEYLHRSLDFLPDQFIVSAFSAFGRNQSLALEVLFNYSEIFKLSTILEKCCFDRYEYTLTYLRFAYISGQYEVIQKLVNHTKFVESDIVETLQFWDVWPMDDYFPNRSFSECSRMLFELLGENTVLIETETLMRNAFLNNDMNLLQIIWKSKHVKKTMVLVEELIYDSRIQNLVGAVRTIVDSLSTNESEVRSFFKLKNSELQAKIDIKTLIFLRGLDKFGTAQSLFNSLGLKMNSELMENCWLSILLPSQLSLPWGPFDYLISHEFLKSNWQQNLKILHMILNYVCENRMISELESILKHFPMINLSANRNEALRKLLENSKTKEQRKVVYQILLIFQKQQIVFNDEKEKEEIIQLAKGCIFDENHLKWISNLPVKV